MLQRKKSHFWIDGRFWWLGNDFRIESMESNFSNGIIGGNNTSLLLNRRIESSSLQRKSLLTRHFNSYIVTEFIRSKTSIRESGINQGIRYSIGKGKSWSLAKKCRSHRQSQWSFWHPLCSASRPLFYRVARRGQAQQFTCLRRHRMERENC